MEPVNYISLLRIQLERELKLERERKGERERKRERERQLKMEVKLNLETGGFICMEDNEVLSKVVDLGNATSICRLAVDLSMMESGREQH